MPGRFANRVAIVTGAGAPDGIGAAVARQLVADGARVVLARDLPNASTTAPRSWATVPSAW